ncbi:MAG: hypothetical protein IK106_00005 [Clostridiales bacterium]|nr:hypothetical protein [Clostridiales bacterium]
MKRTNKTVLTALLAAAIMVSASGCKKKVAEPKIGAGEKVPVETTSGEQSEQEEEEVKGTQKTPNLVGNPDKSRISESGVMPSSTAKEPVITDLRSAYSVINWQGYSEIVSGSEFTVEPYISDAYETTAPDEITMYVFRYNDDYAWNTEDAYAKIAGSPIRAIVDQEYNTVHTYWIKGNLPQDMPTGKYTMVFVLPDGSVDTMVDFMLCQPSEAPTPVPLG